MLLKTRKIIMILRAIYLSKISIQYIIKTQSDIRRFRLDPSTKLLYCRTAKTGSTTWSAYFVQLLSRHRHHSRSHKIRGRKDPPFDIRTAYLERKVINEKQKMKTVNQLRAKKHEYKAFFVCR